MIVLAVVDAAAWIADTIGRIGRSLENTGVRYRILLLDDASSDGTSLVARRAARGLPLRIIRSPERRGPGRVLYDGLTRAVSIGDAVVTMSGDTMGEPELIPAMLGRLDQGFDVVIASPSPREGEKLGGPPFRRLLGRTFRALFRRAAPIDGVQNRVGAFRVYRSAALRSALEGWKDGNRIAESSSSVELGVLARLGDRGARITEVHGRLRNRNGNGRDMRFASTREGHRSALRAVRARQRPRPPSTEGPGVDVPDDRAADRRLRRREAARRALNVAVALAGIIVTAPLMLLVAVLVKITSRGPVLYKQPRVGLDRRSCPDASSQVLGLRKQDLGGRVFTIYKFRTMHHAADEGDAQVWASPDDDRVTFVGRFLRKYRLDELPQLFNVLRGDMNVVGPRPEQPEIFQDLRVRIPDYQSRQAVPPGITGWAQINQHYDSCLEDVRRKVAYDMEYLRRRSPAEDLRIMLLTVPVVLFRRGAW